MRGRGGWKIIFTVLVMCLFAGGSVYADGSDRELTGDVDASDSVLQEGAIPSLEDVSAVILHVFRDAAPRDMLNVAHLQYLAIFSLLQLVDHIDDMLHDRERFLLRCVQIILDVSLSGYQRPNLIRIP